MAEFQLQVFGRRNNDLDTSNGSYKVSKYAQAIPAQVPPGLYLVDFDNRDFVRKLTPLDAGATAPPPPAGSAPQTPPQQPVPPIPGAPPPAQQAAPAPPQQQAPPQGAWSHHGTPDYAQPPSPEQVQINQGEYAVLTGLALDNLTSRDALICAQTVTKCAMDHYPPMEKPADAAKAAEQAAAILLRSFDFFRERFAARLHLRAAGINPVSPEMRDRWDHTDPLFDPEDQERE